MNKVAICTINYTSKNDTLNLLNYLNNLNGDFEVYILENGSASNYIKFKDLPKTKYKKHFYKSKTNLGFAGGNNLLIKKVLAAKKFNYVWLLNNDTKPKKNSLVNLLHTFKTDENCGIAGSVVLQNNNTIWWGGSTVKLRLGKIYKKYYGKKFNSFFKNKQIEQTGEVNGAVMLIKREVIEKIGLMDTTFFHTAEDTDYSLRAKKAGFTLYINFNSVVYHSVGSSSGGAYSPQHMYYVERGRLLLMRKWGYLNIVSFLILLPFLVKRIVAPTIRAKNIRSSFYTIKGIYAGLTGKH